MQDADARIPTRPWYREPWPWILMAGPAAVVVGGAVTAYLAVTHDDPLVVDTDYKEGLAINRVLERDRAARQAGFQAQVLFSEDGSRVRVYLTGGEAMPPSLRLQMVHPTRADLDRAVTLQAVTSPHPGQAGWYEGELGVSAAPRWRVQLEDDRRGWRLTGEWRPHEGRALVLAPRT
jgi:hypothetical protein